MKIIAHRGFWRKKAEQNTLAAFERSIENNFGIELDVRAYNNDIIISHDLPSGLEIKFSDCLRELSRHKQFKNVQFAINVKSDGIESKIAELLLEYGIRKNSFVFDMSIPSMYIFKKLYKNIHFATRHSDIEKRPVLYDSSKWVWMDELEKSWIDPGSIIRHIKNNKLVSVVSPELHKRPHLSAWKKIYSLPRGYADKVYLCTDFCYHADRFFNRAFPKK